MKKKAFLNTCCIFALLMFSLSSCKKGGNNPDATTSTTGLQCRISDVKLNDVQSSETRIEYDSNKRVSAIKNFISGSGVDWASYYYSGNLIIRFTYNIFSRPLSVDTLMIGENGLISTIGKTMAFTHYPQENDTMTYDSKNELLKVVGRSVINSTNNVTTYSWSGGDATGVNINGTPVTYFYYSDKIAKDGDILRTNDLTYYSTHILNCQHLYRGSSAGDSVTYNFDSTGKISAAIVKNGTSVLTYSYSYVCD